MITSIWKNYSFVIIFFILSLIMGLVMIISWEQEDASLHTVSTNVQEDRHEHYELTLNKQKR
ncbi:hypothetical protein [Siminovitchia sp. 179-K 8D1 HS]|uniref:hypothetical protein n=1 Tax=Siminovitchia sp. 179-K 8D1 HS TaxID=3142385 RepID=UPI00399F1124